MTRIYQIWYFLKKNACYKNVLAWTYSLVRVQILVGIVNKLNHIRWLLRQVVRPLRTLHYRNQEKLST